MRWFQLTCGLFMSFVVSALSAQTLRYAATLDGSQEVPPVTTTALGYGTVTLNAAETEIAVKLFFSGLSSNQTMGHIHGSATNGVQGTNTGVIFNIGSQDALTGNFTMTFAPTAAQLADLRAGRWYFNVHSANFPGGEIRGQILPELPYVGVLLPIHENPAVLNAPGASGQGVVNFNADNTGFVYSLWFERLSANQTLGHIHSSTSAATNGPVVFNIGSQGTTSGSFVDQAVTATDEQITLLRAGRMYFNVHTSANTGGEIRGQILRGQPVFARLRGSQEVPAVISNGVGYGFVQLNASETGLLASAFYAGLGSNATVAHIHQGAFGANGPVLFNMTPITTFVGATSGFASYAPFATSQAQVAAVFAGGLYFNVHSMVNSGGEIRGQIDGVQADGFERAGVQSIVRSIEPQAKSALSEQQATDAAALPACHEFSAAASGDHQH